MKIELLTYRDLKNALKRLNDKELSQTIKFCPEDEPFKIITAIEVTEEDVYVNSSDSEDVGTLAELKDTHDEFLVDNYQLLVSKGNVLMY